MFESAIQSRERETERECGARRGIRVRAVRESRGDIDRERESLSAEVERPAGTMQVYTTGGGKKLKSRYQDLSPSHRHVFSTTHTHTTRTNASFLPSRHPRSSHSLSLIYRSTHYRTYTITSTHINPRPISSSQTGCQSRSHAATSRHAYSSCCSSPPRTHHPPPRSAMQGPAAF